MASPAFGSRLLRYDLELITGCCYPAEDSSEARIQSVCCCEVRDVAGKGADGLAPGIEPPAETHVAPPPPRITPAHAGRRETVSFPNPGSAPPALLASLLAQHTSLIV